MADKNKTMRIDKFLSNQLGISRTDAKELIKKRLVTVNGAAVKFFDMKIDPGSDRIISEGREVVYREHIYIMLNKPQGVVCSTKDGLSKTVLELLPTELLRDGLFPAGRLDKDTEGFVFITDDGALAHKILSPKSHVEKLYFARLEKPAEEGYKDIFASGMEIDGRDICLPAKIEICDDPHEAYISIKEGMYHQVKRMAEAVGNRVIYLKRLKIGELALDENLAPGECREIMHKEVEKLYTKFMP